MTDVDTSSYLKPTAQKSLVEQVQGIAGLEQQKQAIDQNKLNQANQALGYMTRAMGSIGPNASKDDYLKVGQNAVQMGLVPENMLHVYEQRLQAAPNSQAFYKEFMSAAMDHQQQIALHTGINTEKSDNSINYQGKTDVLTGGFKPTTQINQQLPPTTSNIDNNPRLPNGESNPNFRAPGYVGPAGPAGVQPAGRLSGAVAQPQAGMPPIASNNSPVKPAGPSLAAKTTGPIGPTIDRTAEFAPTTFNDRFAASGGGGKVYSGAAPGVIGAQAIVGEQSGKDYAGAQARARNFQADLYPATAALEGIKQLGPQGVGPGTEALNSVKSAIVTWLPNVDQKTVDGVKDFEQTRKYLTQIARTSGSTGTNDQLAASFEANPSIKMSSAATENVLKSIIALKKMDQAQTLMFQKSGEDASNFNKWTSEHQNQFDPRAFGFDMMTPEAKKMLVTKLGKDPKALKKFEDTLQFAHDAELIAPPARNQ